MDFSNPESRIEAILQNMLGANNVLDPPESRIEYLLQQILENGGGGGQSAIHVKGVTTTALTDGCDTNPITINGESYTAVDGDLVAYQNKEFLFNGTIWQELGDVSEVMTIIENILEDIAQEFDATASYAVDDYVLKDGVLYKCTTAHTGAWDADDFTATTISDEVADVETALADKQNTITAGLYIQKSGDTISVKRDISQEVDEVLTLTHDTSGGTNKVNAVLTVGGETIDSDTFTTAGGTFHDMVQISFNTRAVRFMFKYLVASKTQSAGYENYIYNEYTDTFADTIGEDDKLIIKSELDTALSSKQDTLTFDDVPTANSNNPVKSGGVKSAIDAAVSSAYHHAGTKTCAELVAGLLVAGNEGNVYNMTDSGTTTSDFIEGQGQPIKAGDNVGIAKISDGVYKFDLLSGFVDTTNFVQKSSTAGLLKNDGTVNDEIEGDVSTLKSGLTNVADDVKLNTQDLTTGSRTQNISPITLSDIKANNTDGSWAANVYTLNDVTFTVSTDSNGNVDGITVNGTASDTTVLTLYNLPSFFTVGKQYVVSGCYSGGTAETYKHDLLRSDAVLTTEYGSGVTVTANSTYVNTNVRERIVVYNGVSLTNAVFLPMVRLATASATYAPYIPSVESRIEAVESGLTDVNSNIASLLTRYSTTSLTGVKYVKLGKLVCVTIDDAELSSTTALGIPTSNNNIVLTLRDQTVGGIVTVVMASNAAIASAAGNTNFVAGHKYAGSFAYLSND